MVRTRLDPLQAVNTRLLTALLEDLLREHGLRDQMALRLLVAHNIKISRITVAQFVERFFAGHSLSSPFDAEFS